MAPDFDRRYVDKCRGSHMRWQQLRTVRRVCMWTLILSGGVHFAITLMFLNGIVGLAALNLQTLIFVLQVLCVIGWIVFGVLERRARLQSQAAPFQ